MSKEKVLSFNVGMDGLRRNIGNKDQIIFKQVKLQFFTLLSNKYKLLIKNLNSKLKTQNSKLKTLNSKL